MRIRPYIKNGNKHKTERSKYVNPDMPDKAIKLEVKNANRSLKKAYRAELKRDLKNLINKKEDNGN